MEGATQEHMWCTEMCCLTPMASIAASLAVFSLQTAVEHVEARVDVRGRLGPPVVLLLSLEAAGRASMRAQK